MNKVTAAVIEKEGKILIAKRKKGLTHEGKWEFPGGRIEPYETAKGCLLREIKEELGIQISVSGLLTKTIHSDGPGQFEFHVFNAEYVGGEPLLNAHDEIKWVGYEELSGYDFLDADREVIRLIEEEKKTPAVTPYRPGRKNDRT